MSFVVICLSVIWPGCDCEELEFDDELELLLELLELTLLLLELLWLDAEEAELTDDELDDWLDGEEADELLDEFDDAELAEDALLLLDEFELAEDALDAELAENDEGDELLDD